MFLFWNYTIEAFFWILLGAIGLVSLTIFFASPRNKPRASVDLETHDGKITETEQYAKKESNLSSSSKKSRPTTEDEKFEEFVETLPKSLQAVISMRTYIGIFYGLLVLAFGFIDLEIGIGINGFYVFFTAIFGSVAFIYGLIQSSYFSTRWGARLMTIYCMIQGSMGMNYILFIDISGIWGITSEPSYDMLIMWSVLVAMGILYSINLTQLIGFTSFEKRPDSYDENNVRYYQWFFEFMNGDRPAAARLLLYLLLVILFLMSFHFINSFT